MQILKGSLHFTFLSGTLAKFKRTHSYCFSDIQEDSLKYLGYQKEKLKEFRLLKYCRRTMKETSIHSQNPCINPSFPIKNNQIPFNLILFRMSLI